MRYFIQCPPNVYLLFSKTNEAVWAKLKQFLYNSLQFRTNFIYKKKSYFFRLSLYLDKRPTILHVSIEVKGCFSKPQIFTMQQQG